MRPLRSWAVSLLLLACSGPDPTTAAKTTDAAAAPTDALVLATDATADADTVDAGPAGVADTAVQVALFDKMFAALLDVACDPTSTCAWKEAVPGHCHDQMAMAIDRTQRAAVAQGSVTLHEAEVAQAIARWQTDYCTGRDLALPVHGTLPGGAPCGQNYQCQSRTCATAPNSPCGSSCLVAALPGQPCGDALGCVDGTVCKGGTCKPLGKSGESCQSGSECNATLVCRAKACSPPGKDGDVCDVNSDCALAMACSDGYCVPGGVGSSCSFASDCPLQMACDAGATDTCLPLPTLGGACSSDSFGCAEADSWCAIDPGATVGVCSVLPPLGAWCGASQGLCLAPHMCDPKTLKCAEEPAENTACVVTKYGCTKFASDGNCYLCAVPLTCNLGNLMCQQPLPPGASCNYDSQCQAGFACSGGKCTVDYCLNNVY